MSQFADKVCLNHPDISAVSRCVTCFKPLCPACIVKRQGQDFCSEICAINYNTTNKSINEFREKEHSRKFARLIKRLIILAVLIVIVLLAFHYLKGQKDKVKETTDQLRNKTEQLKQNLSDKLKKGN